MDTVAVTFLTGITGFIVIYAWAYRYCNEIIYETGFSSLSLAIKILSEDGVLDTSHHLSAAERAQIIDEMQG